MKICVIFGGISTEHEVSIVSGTSVIQNLDKSKYNIKPIYIAKDGTWYFYKKPVEEIKMLKINEEPQPIEKVENIIETLKQFDIVFPVLHGLGGEDGSIQGLFQMANVPYVGCGILASSIGMDKVYTKAILEKANIKQVPYEYIRKQGENYIYIDKQWNETKMSIKEIVEKMEEKLKYPMFVKPSNSGSSVGVKKAKNIEELKSAIQHASQFDNKVLVEQAILAREIECAVLGKQEVEASCLGEVKSAEDFYSFDSKYNNQESKTIIPAQIDNIITKKIRDLAIKAFKTIDGSGLARVDFFIDKQTNEIYLNEINTMPGFTAISMYPKLFAQVGIDYTGLLDRLINL